MFYAIRFLLIVILFIPCSIVWSDNAANQARMDAYYDWDNILTLTITIDAATWAALKASEPAGGRCNDDYLGTRYEWVEADALEIERTSPSEESYQYENVGIKKKSYCGSFNTTKPSLNINIARYDEDNKELAEDDIGTHRLTLNNSKQDPGLLRQCLGYTLFRMIGLPASRCNFTSLYIASPDTPDLEYMGIYVNVEPLKKKYMKNEANGFTASDKGNLYEIAKHDFSISGLVYDEYNGFSDEYIKSDFALATQLMEENGVSGVVSTIDIDEFMSYWAMETIIQHHDGYTRNANNVYVYNDNDLESALSLSTDTVGFKFLPWGIDAIFDQRCWQVYRCTIVPKTLFADKGYREQLLTNISNKLNYFLDNKATIFEDIDSLAASAGKTWTGYDPLFGEQGDKLSESAAELKSWMEAALTGDAWRSIDDGKNNSCYTGTRLCPYQN